MSSQNSGGQMASQNLHSLTRSAQVDPNINVDENLE